MNGLARVELVVGALLFTALSFTGIAAATTADQSTPAKEDVGCLLDPTKLSDAEVGAFLEKPAQLLSDNPGGGLSMSNKVRSLAGSSDKAYDAIIGLVKTANSSQKSAIGAGLSRAVFACKDSQPDFAERMMKGVIAFADADLLAGYTSANADTNVASVTGGASSALGGGSTAESDSQRGAQNDYTYGGNESKENSAEGFTSGDAPVILSRTSRR